MESRPLQSLKRAQPGQPAPFRARQRPQRAGLSIGGVLLFLAAALLAASAFAQLRPEIGGMYLHLCLLPVVLALPLALARLERFPRRTLVALAAFVFLFDLSLFIGEAASLSPIVKLVASGLTIVVAALALTSPADYRAAVLGMCLAGAVIALRGVFGRDSPDRAIDGMELAGPNTQSLYILPALLLAGDLLLRRQPGVFMRVVLGGCMVTMVTMTFMSANRSGWLGVFLIAVMLLTHGRSVRAAVVLGVLAGGCYYALSTIGTTVILERRIDQTVEGNTSDALRWWLFTTAVQIGIEHPVLGISPQVLPRELLRRVPTLHHDLDPHNVFGFLIGGCGLLTTGVFLYLGYTLWRLPRSPTLSSGTRPAQRLVQMMLVLWAVRGMFTSEIIYSPSFSLGLGLTLGIYLVETPGMARPRAARCSPHRLVPLCDLCQKE